MNCSIILFAILGCAAQLIYTQNPTVNAYKEVKTILSNGYDKDISPDLGEKRTTVVTISLHFVDLNFNDKEKTLDSDMYFRQSWTDLRLVRSNSREPVVGGQSLYDSIWKPDTFFPSSLSVRTQIYPAPNLFVRISSNGTISLSQRLQHTSRCRPEQTGIQCSIHFESYGYNANDILYKLKKGPNSMGMPTLITNPNDPDKQYKLVNSTIEEKVKNFSFGNYSMVNIKLLFQK